MATQAPLSDQNAVPMDVDEQPQLDCSVSNAEQPQLCCPVETCEQPQNSCSVNILPQFVMDNLPEIDFHVTVNCRFEQGAKHLSTEQYLDSIHKPTKVLIDARALQPVAFEHLMAAYLSDKDSHPEKEAVIINKQFAFRP